MASDHVLWLCDDGAMKRIFLGSVLEVCVSRGGSVKGGNVASFIGCWALASHGLKRPITIADYQDWWNEPERTAYRHQANFRMMFPGQDNPQAICDALAAEQDRSEIGRYGIGGLLQQPLPELALA